jgi:primosomal protein N''
MLAEVRRTIDRGASDEQICAMLFKDWGFSIKPKTFNKVFVQKYKDWKASVALKKQWIEARAEAIGEGGLSMAARARLWDEVEQMPVAELIKLVRLAQDYERLKVEYGKLEVAKQDSETKRQEAETEKQQLEFEIEQYRKNAQEATDEAIKQIEGGKAVTAEDVIKLRERVFGRSETASSPAAV